MNHRIIVSQRVGRLGNQIFLFANLIAFSLATGVKIAHPTLGCYAQYFAGCKFDIFCNYPVLKNRKRRVLLIERLFLFFFFRVFDRLGFLNLFFKKNLYESDYTRLENLASDKFISLVFSNRTTYLTKGWYFRFEKIHPSQFLNEIQAFFSLSEPYNSNVVKIEAKARNNSDILIGIHMRQTDFKHHENGRFYYTTDQYFSLMQHCAGLFDHKRVAFLIVSDEPKSSSDFPGLNCNFGSGIDVEDMYCLGHCDYIIGTFASSFSLWPAVLFQKPTYRISEPSYRPSLEDFVKLLDPWKSETV